MTLTKNKMIREIGRRTRLRNRDVQLMLETLINVWTEELVSEGRIELENFVVIETQIIDRGKQKGNLSGGSLMYKGPRYVKRLVTRTSKYLKRKLKASS